MKAAKAKIGRLLIGEREDSVLAEEAAETGEADERERADQESEERDRQPFGEPAHPPDVLLVMQHVDDRAGPRKSSALKAAWVKRWNIAACPTRARPPSPCSRAARGWSKRGCA